MVIGKRGYGYAVDYLTGEYERGTAVLCESLLTPGMTVVDIGAHFGYHTLLAARSVGQSGKVYAFEPHPTNYELLLRNVALNGYENVVAVKKAVSDHSGTARLALVGSLQHCLLGDGATKRSSIRVESTSLDEFLESVGSPEVNLIKMDIEGGEKGALRGMTRLIQGSSGLRLIMEYSPSNLEASGTDPLSVLSWLRESGFTIWAIDEKRGGLRPLGPGRAEASNLFCER
jgi:FkbM family methyltransferase